MVGTTDTTEIVMVILNESRVKWVKLVLSQILVKP